MNETRATAMRLLAAFLLAGHFMMAAFSVSPVLHQWLHGDADLPDHVCAVTTTAAGQLDCAGAAPLPELRPLLVAHSRVFFLPTDAEVLRLQEPGGSRAPPLA